MPKQHFAVGAALLLAFVAQQRTLSGRSAATAPQSASPAISLVGAAYDIARGRTVIVGAAPGDSFAQTWEWNGNAWARALAIGPSARDEPMMAYDQSRKRIVLYGGSLGRVVMSDTWEWDGVTWAQRATAGPPPRGGASMAYDSRRRRVMLFGGASVGPGPEHNDLWEWDGATWTRVVADSQPGSPPGRGLYGMAYDDVRGRLVVFGGFAMDNGRPRPMDDTWEWDGRAWQRIDARGPGLRDHVAMVFDPVRRGIVFHGGANAPVTGLLGDTWLYDGRTWTKLLEDGPPRGRHRLVFDARAGTVQLYGGWGPKEKTTELWELRRDGWTRIGGN